jgi:hypothetical protein
LITSDAESRIKLNELMKQIKGIEESRKKDNE